MAEKCKTTGILKRRSYNEENNNDIKHQENRADFVKEESDYKNRKQQFNQNRYLSTYQKY